MLRINNTNSTPVTFAKNHIEDVKHKSMKVLIEQPTHWIVNIQSEFVIRAEHKKIARFHLQTSVHSMQNFLDLNLSNHKYKN